MQDRIKALEKVVSGSDKMELVILNNAFVTATKKSKVDSSTKTIKEWRLSKSELEDFLTELEARYNLSGENMSEYFKTRKEAHNWLVDNGYQISQGKFYQDISKNGFPALNKDKTVSRYQVLEYARQLEEDNTPDVSALERSEYLHRKEKADAEMAEMKAERMKREEDDLWLHADTAWSAVAVLVGSLRDILRRELHDNQLAIVEACGGEVHRAPEIFELVETEIHNKAFNEVARKSIDVQWEGSDGS